MNRRSFFKTLCLGLAAPSVMAFASVLKPKEEGALVEAMAQVWSEGGVPSMVEIRTPNGPIWFYESHFEGLVIHTD